MKRYQLKDVAHKLKEGMYIITNADCRVTTTEIVSGVIQDINSIELYIKTEDAYTDNWLIYMNNEEAWIEVDLPLDIDPIKDLINHLSNI
jgi:hypothetical protein